MVKRQGHVPLFFKELSTAVGDGISNVAADRDKDTAVQLPVPQVDLGGDILKPESPRARV
jgi:hypothetical protein